MDTDNHRGGKSRLGRPAGPFAQLVLAVFFLGAALVLSMLGEFGPASTATVCAGWLLTTERPGLRLLRGSLRNQAGMLFLALGAVGWVTVFVCVL
ncbi:MAG: hypothetical protein HS107_10930 [Thermoflexaceae bacterium]|nr:hypothetical protein [Thermoflexaceae bacterium]